MCFKSAELSNIIDNTDVMGFALEQFGKEEGVPSSVKFIIQCTNLCIYNKITWPDWFIPQQRV